MSIIADGNSSSAAARVLRSRSFPPGWIGPVSPLFSPEKSPYPSNEFHVHPQYRTPRGLDAVLQKANAKFDDFHTEKYHDQVAAILSEWSSQLLESPQKTAAMEKVMPSNFSGASPKPISSQSVRAESTLQAFRMKFSDESQLGREAFLGEWRSVMNTFSAMVTAEFQVTSIRVEDSPPPESRLGIPLKTRIRFELVGTGAGFYREQRVGNWELQWELRGSGERSFN